VARAGCQSAAEHHHRGAVVTRSHPKQGGNERASFGLDLRLCASTATGFYNSLYNQARRTADPINGNGGLYASARWHTTGRPVYRAQPLSLAALEILVRLKQTNDIRPFYAYSAEGPDSLILKPDSLSGAMG
jgi:hypothetical protein